mmetsp:Transcript_89420/g.289195  ORF Transcript_89420/g.289195 Transcript_89420/m.289195 type:complete len:226 (+) Transcript_89420:136-813(+)
MGTRGNLSRRTGVQGGSMALPVPRSWRRPCGALTATSVACRQQSLTRSMRGALRGSCRRPASVQRVQASSSRKAVKPPNERTGTRCTASWMTCRPWWRLLGLPLAVPPGCPPSLHHWHKLMAPPLEGASAPMVPPAPRQRHGWPRRCRGRRRRADDLRAVVGHLAFESGDSLEVGAYPVIGGRPRYRGISPDIGVYPAGASLDLDLVVQFLQLGMEALARPGWPM